MSWRVLHRLLSEHAGVASHAGGRVYRGKAPQGTAFPYVVAQRIGYPRVGTLDGPGGLGYQTWQVDCWGVTPDQAETLAARVRCSYLVGGPLDGFRGLVGPYFVQEIRKLDERDLPEQPQKADEAGIHRVSFDFLVVVDE